MRTTLKQCQQIMSSEKNTQQTCSFSLDFLHSSRFSCWLDNSPRINGSFIALTVSAKVIVFSFEPGKRMPTFLFKNFKMVVERDHAFVVGDTVKPDM